MSGNEPMDIDCRDGPKLPCEDYIYRLFERECRNGIDRGAEHSPSPWSLAGALLCVKDKDEENLPDVWKGLVEKYPERAEGLRQAVSSCIAPDGSQFIVKLSSNFTPDRNVFTVWNSDYPFGMPPANDNDIPPEGGARRLERVSMSNPQDPNWVGYWAPTNSSRAPRPSARRAVDVYARHVSYYQSQKDSSLPASCGDQSEDLLEQKPRNVGEDTPVKNDPVNEHKDSPGGSSEKSREANLADETTIDLEMMDQDLPEEQDELHDEGLEHVAPALLEDESCSS
ncbi:hypothetical protein FDECE_7208, partial [Fusarium decemcellulare]